MQTASIHGTFTPQDHYQEHGRGVNGEDDQLQHSFKDFKEDRGYNFVEIGPHLSLLSIPSLDDKTTLAAGSSSSLPTFKLLPLYPTTASDSVEPAASIAWSETSSTSTSTIQPKDIGIHLPHLDDNDKMGPSWLLPQVSIKQKKACPQA